MKDDIRLIAAVGRQGQLGLGDRIPWHDPEDLRWFKTQTKGGIVLVGQRTAATLPPLPGRTLWVARSAITIDETLRCYRTNHADRTLWIAGGETVYRAWMPHVRICVITRVDYDGPADAWMPPLWESR